jgi:hypothetical protein
MQGKDMRTTKTMILMMRISNLVKSQEICLLVVRSRVWLFRIPQTETEMTRERL